MTPLGMWEIGNEAFLWVRFLDDAIFLLSFAIMGLSIVVLLYKTQKSLQQYVRWKSDNLPKDIIYGIFGAIVVAGPILIIYLFIPIEYRGGEFPIELLPILVVMALFGNLFEEIFFRGYFQGYMEKRISKWKAGVFSGLAFAFGHIFLSATVTDLGITLLIFCFYEGTIAGLVYAKTGLIGSTLTHGLAIFLISSGLF